MTNSEDFLLSSYRFDLPNDLIADQPLANRDESKLLVFDRSSGIIEHKTIRDLPALLSPDTVCFANNSKVFNARLLGHRDQTQGKVEFFLLRRITPDEEIMNGGASSWQGLMRSSATIQPGFKFYVQDIEAVVQERIDSSSEYDGVTFIAKFSKDPVIANVGQVPLPPYIMAKRLNAARQNSETKSNFNQNELEIYNTVFAKNLGSVAAPTAGRHFTPELIESLKRKGIPWEEITLHVGIGTFKPVTCVDIRQHRMHPETISVSVDVAERLERYRQQHKNILAIGTTTARCLESRTEWQLDKKAQTVNPFFYPGCVKQWNTVNMLLTNFHLPESTLLMMVADFIGSRVKTLEIYQEAIRARYRFYSYGDAMLIK